jgi:hypothetical protein
MNEQYNKTIEIEGRVYRYDPDSDCYYRSHDQPLETAQERWTKVAIATVLLIILVVGAPPLLEWLK